MKLNVKWFTISSMIVVTIPMILLFIAFVLFGLGGELVKLFESIHPGGGFSLINNIDKDEKILFVGILINIIWTMVDVFLFAFALSSLYNSFLDRFAE